MKIKEVKKVYFIGIGGSGVSALAKYFIASGADVTGSNIVDENLYDLRHFGIKIFVGHKEENLKNDVDIVVYSSAVPMNNPEILKAQKLGIKTLSYTEALGDIMSDSFGIAVSGTNGKTTTTALLGLMLVKGKMDPTVILGGNVKKWSGNFNAGKGEIFLAEGCEYKKNILNLSPKMIVLTNIEADHLDCYPGGIEEIKSTFHKYVQKLPTSGVIVTNSDDKNITEVVEGTGAINISYGIENDSDLLAKDIIIKDGRQEFEVVWKGEKLGKFTTHLPGKFNIYNILSATATALSLGVSAKDIKTVVLEFRGTERRFEVFDSTNGKIIISDYAHHPTSVRETIRATKNIYNNKKILTVFQPHQKDRTIKFFDDFTKSFDEAPELILAEIYEVSGRNSASREVSSNDMVKVIQERNKDIQISYTKDNEETENLIREKMDNFDVILIMGAGDINKVVKNLVN